MEKCIKCNHSTDGRKVILNYFADDAPETLQRQLASNFNVDEGDICCDCWKELKTNNSHYEILSAFTNFGSKCL